MKQPRQHWLVILIALIGILLPSRHALAADLPTGWEIHPVGDLSLGLPNSWQKIALTKPALQSATDEVKDTNPELARILQNLIDSNQYQILKFFAIEPASKQNINVAIVPVGVRLKPKDIVAVLAKQIIQNLPNATLVESKSNLVLNGMPAARVIYDLPVNRADGKPDVLRGFQYYLPVDTSIYIISITGDSSRAFRSLVEQIAGTVQPLSSIPASDGIAVVKSTGNVRAAPSTAAKIIDKISAKEKLTLIGKNKAGTWVKITTPRGKTGWSSVKLLNIDPAVLKQLKVVP